jgi:hypothetical protein
LFDSENDFKAPTSLVNLEDRNAAKSAHWIFERTPSNSHFLLKETPMHSSLPYWMDPEIPKEFDIACLRPANLPRGERFETEDDVYDRADCYIVPNLRDLRIAFKIEKCADPNSTMHCLLPICPICARHYRRFFISEVLRIYTENPAGAQTATAYLGSYKAGNLKDASLNKAHERFRKQLQCCGFSGAGVIGGTEVTYRHETNDWLLHLHLLALGASEQAWENLEKPMSKYGVHDPLHGPKSVNDPIKQLSYLQKFHTYHRPGTPQGNNPARAMPLKESALRIGVLGMQTRFS